MFLFVHFSSLLVRPVVYIPRTSNVTREGYSVNLTCKIKAGLPKPEISWFKNKTLKGKSMSLLLTKIRKKDEGRYTCEAKNDGGVSTDSIHIFVQGKFYGLLILTGPARFLRSRPHHSFLCKNFDMFI